MTHSHSLLGNNQVKRVNALDNVACPKNFSAVTSSIIELTREVAPRCGLECRVSWLGLDSHMM